MLPAVFVDVRFEARGQARPFAVIGIVAPSARRTGRTAATGVGTVPRAGDMGLAHAAGTVTTRTCHDQTRRRGQRQLPLMVKRIVSIEEFDQVCRRFRQLHIAAPAPITMSV